MSHTVAKYIKWTGGCQVGHIRKIVFILGQSLSFCFVLLKHYQSSLLNQYENMYCPTILIVFVEKTRKLRALFLMLVVNGRMNEEKIKLISFFLFC